MKRIRTKLVLALLVVALIPVVPSYFLARDVVQHLFDLFVNDTVKETIRGAVDLSARLHRRYADETMRYASDLAERPEMVALLKGQLQGLDWMGVEALGPHRIDAYDAGKSSVASWSNVPDSLLQDSASKHPLATRICSTSAPRSTRSSSVPC
ncbi:MAG: hypothetical protein VCF24_28525 [Candidatus Latescibacterota bacterium]|jgi:hypothetical protein